MTSLCRASRRYINISSTENIQAILTYKQSKQVVQVIQGMTCTLLQMSIQNVHTTTTLLHSLQFTSTARHIVTIK